MQFVTTSIPVQAAEKVMTMTSAISAAWLLRHLEYAGLHIEVSGKNIRIFPANKLTDAYRKAIKEHKRELLALLRDTSPKPLPEAINQEPKKEDTKGEEFGCPV